MMLSPVSHIPQISWDIRGKVQVIHSIFLSQPRNIKLGGFAAFIVFVK